MNWKIFFITLSRLFTIQSVISSASFKEISDSQHKFGQKLAASAALEVPRENFAISPLITQTALTLLYSGATDNTATDLRSALELQRFPNAQVAVTKMTELLSSSQNKWQSGIHLANAVYVQERLSLDFKPNFKHNAQMLDVNTQRVSLGKDNKALENINYWFLTKTNYTIGQLLYANMLHDDLNFILASAVSFKASWAKAFDVKNTEMLNFHSDARNHKLVETMFLEHKFKYAELKNLKAKVVEIPFKTSGVSMIIFYPDEINGLAALEQKLGTESLNDILDQMSLRKMALSLPKFRLEFSWDLKNCLSNLGLGAIFQSSAKFNNVFSSLFSALNPFVTRVQHKTLVEIDESGGNEESDFAFGDLFKRKTQLTISHPFYFMIKTPDSILLSGHIVNL